MKELVKRDRTIRKNYKLGQGGKIGRELGISRQRVFQIRHEKQGFWTRLFDKVYPLFSKD